MIETEISALVVEGQNIHGYEEVFSSS